jgi:hypothetical protein
MEVDDSTVDMIEAIQFLTQFVDAAIIDDLRYYTCGVDLATVSVVHDVAAVNWILEGF